MASITRAMAEDAVSSSTAENDAMPRDQPADFETRLPKSLPCPPQYPCSPEDPLLAYSRSRSAPQATVHKNRPDGPDHPSA